MAHNFSEVGGSRLYLEKQCPPVSDFCVEGIGEVGCAFVGLGEHRLPVLEMANSPGHGQMH